MVHEGLTLAIVGRPNVGKSSLFNRLVERERAIVTATPGTTRDLVSETVSIGGIPVRLVDTAGIRTALDEAESIGVRKSVEAIADANIVLVVLDVSEFAAVRFHARLGAAGEDPGPPAHCGLQQERPADRRSQPIARKLPVNEQAPRVVFTSALTGEGIEELRAHDSGRSARRRRRRAGKRISDQRPPAEAGRGSHCALDRAAAAVPLKTPHEMMLLDLYSALRPLDDITGATTADDILNLIFSSFCIGK